MSAGSSCLAAEPPLFLAALNFLILTPAEEQSRGAGDLSCNTYIPQVRHRKSGSFGVFADGTGAISFALRSPNDNEVAVQSQKAPANNNRKANNVGGSAPRCAPNAGILVQ
jgi:hypothetical protein